MSCGLQVRRQDGTQLEDVHIPENVKGIVILNLQAKVLPRWAVGTHSCLRLGEALCTHAIIEAAARGPCCMAVAPADDSMKSAHHLSSILASTTQSYAGGRDLFGLATDPAKLEKRGFQVPIFNDGLLEVCSYSRQPMLYAI